MMLTAIVVDDEAPARKRLRDLLETEPEIELVAECEDGPAAVTAIRELEPDVVFLDVQMPEMSGFDVIAEVGVDRMGALIFVTAYDHHALEAFDARAIDYLLKPFTRERFRDALARARNQSRGGVTSMAEEVERLIARRDDRPERIAVKQGGRIRFVDASDVEWIAADGNYVVLHAGGSKHRARGTLKEFVNRLKPFGFLRIHHSHAVNLDRVKELQGWGHGDFLVILGSGTQLVTSRTYGGELRRRLNL